MGADSGPRSAEVTELLRQWQRGDRAALDRLIPLVYDELRLIAKRHVAREWRAGSLQTTALVNEAYLKLVDQRQANWQNRAQFFAVAAQVMRRLLVDAARHRLRDKRGGGETPVPIDAVSAPDADAALDRLDVVALDRAMSRLERLDPIQSRIVDLRFFVGLTVEETAAVLDVSPTTVKREWAIARAWLYRQLTGAADQA